MVGEAKLIEVAPGSEVDRVLEAADAGPVVLDRGGVRYRVVRETGPATDDSDDDPKDFRKALEETAGSWADLDTDKIIEDIYRWREEGLRPPDRPRWPT
jgi:hypothetical protein